MIRLGAVDSGPDPRDYLFEESDLAGASPAQLDTVPSLIDLHRWIVQQSNSCVGCTLAEQVQVHAAVNAALGRRAAPLPLLSWLYPYAVARILGGQNMPGTGLPDHGCSYRWAARGAIDHGLVSAERWPDLPENVHEVPPLDVFVAGSPEAARVTAFHFISNGPSAVDGIRAALDLARAGKCSPPGFVMQVDQKYAAIGKAVYDSPGGVVLGGHAQVILEHLPILKAFAIAGTWGPDVGDGGVFYISERYMAEHAREISVVESDVAEVAS